MLTGLAVSSACSQECRELVKNDTIAAIAGKLLAIVAVLYCCTLYSQSPEQPQAGAPTFKSKVQVVLLDVVVHEVNGQPIQGLPQDAFEIFEDGKRQTIASFEEHRGNPPTKLARLPPQPPHFFTNAPTAEPPGSINVLLLDELNTEFEDQPYVRQQIIKYLQTIDRGPQFAIFALGSRLRMVEGFTDDPKLLIEALDQRRRGGTPETSPMLRTQPEDNLDTNMLERMREARGVNPATIAALSRFQAEMAATEQVSRMSATLGALEALSRYLNGFHGRKNLIWFSGSFPQGLFSSGSGQTGPTEDDRLSAETRNAINLVAAAQIAVYPVGARGLETQGLYQAQNVSHPLGPGATPGERVITGQNESLNNENVNRYFNYKAADDIASETGGQAVYNSNGLKEALADIVHNGAFYYQISYSPTNKRMLGRYRHITVKIKKGPHATPHSIAYRRGYYEEDAKQRKPVHTELPTDMLHPLMARGIPDVTELAYRIRLLPAVVQPLPGAPLLGDNKNLHDPVVRVSADLIVPVENLEFEMTGDGVRHAKIELALAAYDHAGRALNWTVRFIQATLKPNIYPVVQKTGVQFHQEIDVPNGDVYIRSGVYDLESNKAGTIEVPLRRVVATEDLLTKAQKTDSGNPVPLASSAVALPQTAAPQSTSPNPVSLAKTLSETNVISKPSESGAPETSPRQTKELEPADTVAYCSALAGIGERSSVLAKVCEFTFSVRKTLPDVICEEKVERWWYTVGTQFIAGGGPAVHLERHADLVTAKLAYKNGQEYYGDIRVSGKPVESGRPPGGDWSQGEFAAALFAIFSPSSKAQFRFKKMEKLGSRQAAVFEFNVHRENNKSYFLRSGTQVWFPDYAGFLWIDQQTARIARVKRVTSYMPDRPITRATTTIDYAALKLADGSSLVLPTGSETLTCSPVSGCARNLISFSNWHKFGATTTITFNPAN